MPGPDQTMSEELIKHLGIHVVENQKERETNPLWKATPARSPSPVEVQEHFEKLRKEIASQGFGATAMIMSATGGHIADVKFENDDGFKPAVKLEIAIDLDSRRVKLVRLGPEFETQAVEYLDEDADYDLEDLTGILQHAQEMLATGVSEAEAERKAPKCRQCGQPCIKDREKNGKLCDACLKAMTELTQKSFTLSGPIAGEKIQQVFEDEAAPWHKKFLPRISLRDGDTAKRMKLYTAMRPRS